jgi:O2-independent ubiquinone biosynthesis accessory factor UbiT
MTLPSAIPKLLKPIPVPLAERAGQLAFTRVLDRHPALLDRLGEFANKTYCFAPIDLPFEFAVTPRSAKVRAAHRGRILRYDTRISGPVVLLLALAEGRLDGDAEFFARQLSIDGDMEAVLALRNAIENDTVDFVRDFAPARGPLRGPIEKTLDHVRSRLLAREERRWN